MEKQNAARRRRFAMTETYRQLAGRYFTGIVEPAAAVHVQITGSPTVAPAVPSNTKLPVVPVAACAGTVIVTLVAAVPATANVPAHVVAVVVHPAAVASAGNVACD